jgi:phenylpyruvate tautomerase PptA (4-oxalocrotonate tautomerase family)
MPILDIEIVAPDSARPSTSSGQAPPTDLAQSLANEAAQVFGAPQGTVWVKVRVVSSEQYAENGGKPEGVYPVFVAVLKSRLPERSALEDEISGLTQVVANTLNYPVENVHIFYQPGGVGRIAFGGKLVE